MERSRKMRHVGNALVVSVLLIVCAACSKNPLPLWSQYRHVDNGGWDALETLDYQVPIAELPPHSDVRAVISIRHTAQLPYRRIRVAVEQTDSLQVVANDTITVTFANPSGAWLGRKSNALIELNDTIDIPLHVSGDGLTISLTPANREAVIPGIVNVGIILFDPANPRIDMLSPLSKRKIQL